SPEQSKIGAWSRSSRSGPASRVELRRQALREARPAAADRLDSPAHPPTRPAVSDRPTGFPAKPFHGPPARPHSRLPLRRPAHHSAGAPPEHHCQPRSPREEALISKTSIEQPRLPPSTQDPPQRFDLHLPFRVPPTGATTSIYHTRFVRPRQQVRVQQPP